MDDATSTAVASATDSQSSKSPVRPKRLGRGLLDLLSGTPVEVKAQEFAAAVDAVQRDRTEFVSATPLAAAAEAPSPASHGGADMQAGTSDCVVASIDRLADSPPMDRDHPSTGAESEKGNAVAGGHTAEPAENSAATLNPVSQEIAPDSADELGVAAIPELAAAPTPEEELAAIAGNLEAAVRLLSEHRDTPLLLLQRSLRIAWSAAAVAAVVVIGVVWWAAATTTVQRERIERLQADLVDARGAAKSDASASTALDAKTVIAPPPDRTGDLKRLEQELETTRSALTKANVAIDELMSRSSRP